MSTLHRNSLRIGLSAFLFAAVSSQAQLAKGQCKFLGNIITRDVPSDYDLY